MARSWNVWATLLFRHGLSEKPYENVRFNFLVLLFSLLIQYIFEIQRQSFSRKGNSPSKCSYRIYFHLRVEGNRRKMQKSVSARYFNRNTDK